MGIGNVRQMAAAGAGEVLGAQGRQSRELVYVGKDGIHPDSIETMVNGKPVEVRWDENGPYVKQDIFKKTSVQDKEGFSYEYLVKVGTKKVYLKTPDGNYNIEIREAANFKIDDPCFKIWVDEVYRVYNGLKNFQIQSTLTDDSGKTAKSVYAMINGEKYNPCVGGIQVVYLGDDGKWYRMEARASRNSGYDGGTETNVFSDFCFVPSKDVVFKKVIPQKQPRHAASRGGTTETKRTETVKPVRDNAVGTYNGEYVYCERQSGRPPKYFTYKEVRSQSHYGDQWYSYDKVEIKGEEIKKIKFFKK